MEIMTGNENKNSTGIILNPQTYQNYYYMTRSPGIRPMLKNPEK